ncbi:hypothetical protein GE09DRAFT_1151825 [Coniochaeta sp. 2T2.1]|nr:hypothetical protein GE09DRAFT_1151825 [Coniochaeta sp. 2T2.1]
MSTCLTKCWAYTFTFVLAIAWTAIHTHYLPQYLLCSECNWSSRGLRCGTACIDYRKMESAEAILGLWSQVFL